MSKQFRINLSKDDYWSLKGVKAVILKTTEGKLDMSLKDIVGRIIKEVGLVEITGKIIEEWIKQEENKK